MLQILVIVNKNNLHCFMWYPVNINVYHITKSITPIFTITIKIFTRSTKSIFFTIVVLAAVDDMALYSIISSCVYTFRLTII